MEGIRFLLYRIGYVPAIPVYGLPGNGAFLCRQRRESDLHQDLPASGKEDRPRTAPSLKDEKGISQLYEAV